jgi:hypothetical protein
MFGNLLEILMSIVLTTFILLTMPIFYVYETYSAIRTAVKNNGLYLNPGSPLAEIYCQLFR